MALCIGQDGAFLVDSDYAPMSDKVQAAIAELDSQPVEFLFNTHWHFDHTGGNEAFGKGETLIVAHANVRRHLASDQFITIIDREVPASPAAALPKLTFSDSLTFHLNGEEIFIFHPPLAHSDGDGVVHFRRANVIHTGDIFFNFGYPFIDVSHGGTIDGMIAAVQAILLLCDGETKIIPGHGPLANKEDLQRYRNLLQEFRDIVAAEKAAGKDLPTIQAEAPTARLDAEWGGKIFPPDLFTEMVFTTLAGP
jgi:glyoxylase-like metal-dependent hydrolase (beta-lactamase superfamily II)